MISRNCLSELADNLPNVLKYICEGNYLKPSELTFALEYLGGTEIKEFGPYLESVCLDTSMSPMVREGAYYGLYSVYGDDNSDYDFSKVLDSFKNSTSPGLQAIAKDD